MNKGGGGGRDGRGGLTYIQVAATLDRRNFRYATSTSVKKIDLIYVLTYIGALIRKLVAASYGEMK